MNQSVNIYAAIAAANAARHSHPAVVDSGRRTTYGELFEAVERAAATLARYGLGAGTRAVLRVPDSTEHIALALALLKLGAIQIPASHTLPDHEAEALIAGVGADVVIAPATAAATATAPGTVFDCLGTGFRLERRDGNAEFTRNLAGLGAAFIRFTSGTTAASRGVILSHEAILHRTDSADAGLRVGPGDTVLWVLAMAYHFVVTILLFLRRGATIVLCEPPAALAMPEQLRQERITLLYQSPFHYRMMCDSTAFDREMTRSVRLAVSTAMPLDRATAEDFRAKFGFRPRQAYGIIEAGLPCVDLDGEAFEPGRVGRPLPPCEVRIVAPDADGIGSIRLRSPGMFSGYLNPFQRREELGNEGFFDTGDLGKFDAAGRLVLVGRSKNVINFAGMKIFPYEVEETLRAFPSVADAAVYAVPDPLYGERPAADVVFLDGGGDDPDARLDALRRFCYTRLDACRVPKEFRRCDRLERTASGKIARRPRP